MLEFQGQAEGACIDSHIWDVANPGEPEGTLSPKSALVCVAYNLKDGKVHAHGSLLLCHTPEPQNPIPRNPWIITRTLRLCSLAMCHVSPAEGRPQHQSTMGNPGTCCSVTGVPCHGQRMLYPVKRNIGSTCWPMQKGLARGCMCGAAGAGRRAVQRAVRCL